MFWTAFLGGVGHRGYGGAVVGATEFTQIANNIELAASYAEQVQQTIQQHEMVRNQLNSYKLQLQNIAKLDDANWENASGTLHRLADIVRETQRIGYIFEHEDEAFRQLHRGYDEYVSELPDAAALGERFRQWSRYNLTAANRAANVAGITLAEMSNEQTRVDALKRAGANAKGQLAAIEAGTVLSAEILDQLRILKQLTAQQMATQAAYVRIAEEQKSQERAHLDRSLEEPVLPEAADAYGPME